MKLGDRERRALRPDAQPFDEVKMVTVPRYKTSGLSGDEWRISVRIQFLRKGKVIYETMYSSMEYACGLLFSDYVRCCEHSGDGERNGGAYFAGEGELCDQEGCAANATVTYRLKKEFCRNGHGTEPSEVVIRKFCNEHRQRGDCGLEDADANYELQVHGGKH